MNTTGWNPRRTITLVLFVVLQSMACLALPPQASGLGGKRDVTVMTRNAYLGANLDAIVALDPSDPMFLMNLVEAVTETYYTVVLQNDFHVRAAGIAGEIAAAAPDLVALQEMIVVRRQSPGDLVLGGTTPASDVVIDYIDVLLEALAGRGAHYTVVSVVSGLDVELPAMNLASGQLDDVRMTDRHVILARTDLPPGHLTLRNARSGHFVNNRAFPTVGVVYKRGWCSVDAFVRGRTFRFVSTHLEQETAPELQWLQAQEILAGPADTHLPVILVGDFNSDANGQNGTLTYDGLMDAGFGDAWSAVHPGDPGLTWGHDPFLANPEWSFVWRIDLILFRGGTFVPQEASVLDTLLPRSEPPLWPSDHGGVVARIRLE